MKKVLLLLLVLAIAGGGWWWWRGRTEKKDAPQYREITVERGNIRETVLATGTLEPQIRLELASPVAGRLEEVLVREGDSVTKGQIVAWVSSTERATLLDAARARGPEELAKWEKLYNPTPVIAPLDGTVIARSLEPGQTVGSTSAIIVLSDRLIVRADVDETDMARIALQQKAEVRLDAYPNQILPARVEHIAYESETVNNVTIYKIEVLPENPPAFIRSGMSAAVTFIVKQTNDVLILPVSAVQMQNGGATVLTPSPHHKPEPTAKSVTVGMDDGRNVQILDGLNEGDTVLIQNYDFVTRASDNAKSSPLSPFGRRRH